MKTYYVYILECSDKTLYTGVTNDIERRVSEHKTGYNPTSYTFNRRPLELIFISDFQDVNQAIDFEKQLKGWGRKKKLAFIKKEYDKLKILSKRTKLKIKLLGDKKT